MRVLAPMVEEKKRLRKCGPGFSKLLNQKLEQMARLTGLDSDRRVSSRHCLNFNVSAPLALRCPPR